MRLFLLIVSLQWRSTAAVAAATLTKALGSTARPVVVHLWDPKPAELASYAVDDVSAACRDAGATAVLVAPELVGAVAEEQAAHRGNFPGPVPVVADCALNSKGELTGVDMAACREHGASAIGIRYYAGDWDETTALEEALNGAIGAAEASGLGAILLAEFGADGDEGASGAGKMASRVGAAAGLAKGAPDAAEDGDGGALALGCWNGDEAQLQRLRDAGFGGLVLKDACRGDVARGSRESSPSLAAQRVSKLVRAALSKSSRTWGGSMFGSEKVAATPSLDSYFERS